MAGTRADGVVDQPTILTFQFLKNGIAYDPLSFDKVEIYDDYDKAVAGNPGDIIETILTGNIIHIGTGLFQYTAAALSQSNAYHDKVFITPDPGIPQWTRINSFYIRKESYGGVAPGEIETCLITQDLKDILATITESTRAEVQVSKAYSFYGKTLIVREGKEYFDPDSEGVLQFSLIETDTLSTDTGEEIYYTIRIDGYKKIFQIRKGTLDAFLVDLPEYTP